MRPECKNKATCPHAACQFLRAVKTFEEVEALEGMESLSGRDRKGYERKPSGAVEKFITYVAHPYVVAALVPLVRCVVRVVGGPPSSVSTLDLPGRPTAALPQHAALYLLTHPTLPDRPPVQRDRIGQPTHVEEERSARRAGLGLPCRAVHDRLRVPSEERGQEPRIH